MFKLKYKAHIKTIWNLLKSTVQGQMWQLWWITADYLCSETWYSSTNWEGPQCGFAQENKQTKYLSTLMSDGLSGMAKRKRDVEAGTQHNISNSLLVLSFP